MAMQSGNDANGRGRKPRRMDYRSWLFAFVLAAPLAAAVPAAGYDACEDKNLPPNINYLGNTWDLLKAEPHNLAQSATQHNVFDLEAAVCVPGTTWQRPAGTLVSRDPSGWTKTSSTLLKTAWDYQQKSTDSVSVGVGVPEVFSFSASASFSQFTETSGSEMSFVSHTEQVHNSYVAQVNPNLRDAGNDRLAVSSDFGTDVAALPTDYDQDAYRRWITKWGTHYSPWVQMGGRALLSKTISASTFSKLVSEKVDIEAGASGTYEEVSGQVNASSSTEDTKKFKSLSKTTLSDLQYVGGNPNLNPFSEWSKTVDDNPAPIKIQLEFLSKLLVAPYFADQPGLDQRRANLEKAINDYLKEEGIPAVDLSHAKPVYEYFYSYSGPQGSNQDIRRYSLLPPEQLTRSDYELWELKGVPFLAFDTQVDGAVPVHEMTWEGAPWVYCYGDSDGSQAGNCHYCNHGYSTWAWGSNWSADDKTKGQPAFYVPGGSSSSTVPVYQWEKYTHLPDDCEGIDLASDMAAYAYGPAGQQSPCCGWKQDDVVFYGISSRICTTGNCS
jgi:MAC/Perforin domain